MNILRRSIGPLKNRQGVALPLALVGLVAVSLLVTTALVTSSTEVALSNAHQEGARVLYRADGALEQFVFARSGVQTAPDQRLQNANYPLTLDGIAYTVSSALLGQSGPVNVGGGTLRRTDTYSLVAQPTSGRGRGVGALIQVTRMAPPVSLNINSGLTLGANATISGNATISNGSDAGANCAHGPAQHAITHSSETNVHVQGSAADIIGGVQRDAQRNSAQLMAHVLNGTTIAEFANRAHIKFGPMYGQPAFVNASGPNASATNISYRWGCPSHLVSGCNSQQAQYFPVVAIDANGGEVHITGDHAQGTLIIRNGDLKISGNFMFQGILLVEGVTRIYGTPRIEGAVIGMGAEAVIDPGEEAENYGNSVIRFNMCQIQSAQQGLTQGSLDSQPQDFNNPTFAWFEVLR